MNRIPRLLWYLAGIWGVFIVLVMLPGLNACIGDGHGDLEVVFQVVDSNSGLPIENPNVVVNEIQDGISVPAPTVPPLLIDSNRSVFVQSNNGFSTYDYMLGPFTYYSKLYVQTPTWRVTVYAEDYETQEIGFLPHYVRELPHPPEPERLRPGVYRKVMPIRMTRQQEVGSCE